MRYLFGSSYIFIGGYIEYMGCLGYRDLRFTIVNCQTVFKRTPIIFFRKDAPVKIAD